jgi:hypothetical protein
MGKAGSENSARISRIWNIGERWQIHRAALAWRRSGVRVPSGPLPFCGDLQVACRPGTTNKVDKAVTERPDLIPLNRLLGRADEDLVDAHPLGLDHGVDYGIRDVFRLQPLQVHKAAESLAGVLVCDVMR